MKPASSPSSLIAAGVLVGALAACGGESLFAVLAYVGPIGGAEQAGTQGAGNWQTIGGEQILFSIPGDSFQLFPPPDSDISADVTTAAAACGGALTGLKVRFDGPGFTFSVPNNAQQADCLRGEFVDEITLRMGSGNSAVLYRNAADFSPRFGNFLWVNPDRVEQKLKFAPADAPRAAGVIALNGCELTGGVKTGTAVIRYVDSDRETGARVDIQSITITRSNGTETWTGGRLYGLNGIRLSGPNGRVQLERRNELTVCP